MNEFLTIFLATLGLMTASYFLCLYLAHRRMVRMMEARYGRDAWK